MTVGYEPIAEDRVTALFEEDREGHDRVLYALPGHIELARWRVPKGLLVYADSVRRINNVKRVVAANPSPATWAEMVELFSRFPDATLTSALMKRAARS